MKENGDYPDINHPEDYFNQDPPYSKEFRVFAQDTAEHFVEGLGAHGLSPEQIKAVLAEVSTWYGINRDNVVPTVLSLSSRDDTKRLKHAAEWVTEVTSRAEYVLFNKTGKNEKFRPNEILARNRPTNRDVETAKHVQLSEIEPKNK